jgi:hypothetical protein
VAALRAAPEQGPKDAARDLLLALPPPPAPPLTDRERDIVVARIDEERSRWLRDRAARLLDAGKLRGALRLLEVVKGSLAEESTARVIGDPKGAERREREVADLRVRILGDMDPAEKADADALAAKCRADPERLLREVARLRKEGKLLHARRVLQGLVLDPAAAAGPKERGRALMAEIEKESLEALDAAERKAVEEALGSPVFGRLRAVASREFLYIGDTDLVSRIPERSRHLLDCAYVALTDLAGRVPNGEGDRVTVFFKELWDFGGGIGGGTRIDIGRADPRAKAVPLVHGNLFFHELSHCVLVPDPRLPGWMEGIADFGAAFCARFLRQEGPEWPAARAAAEAFRRDYLGREEAFWRSAPYGPTAGWFLHWGVAHGARPDGEPDWARYGRVLRGWLAPRPRPVTVAGTARAFAALLAREFGEGVWADLRAQRYPVEEGEPVDPALPDGEGWRRGEAARASLAGRPADAADAEERAAAGIVHGWRVAGPFYPPEWGDGLATPFAPERETVLDREYPGPRQVAKWYAPGGPVAEDGAGIVTASWAYPEGSVTYGRVDLEVPEDADAWIWVGTEHRWALRVDGVLAEMQEWEEGAFVPDRDRVAVRLRKGRRSLLLKVALGWTGPTFAVRVTDRAGRGIPGLRCLPPENRIYDAPVEAATKAHFLADFGGAASTAAWTFGPGGFQVRNRALRGVESRGAVPWRKYSVRPGFPQDSPSNQATLDPAVMAKAGKDVRVEVAFTGTPKIALTLDAEEAAGGLTGWTVVISPGGGGTADVRLERYDRLIHLVEGVAAKGRGEHVVVVDRRGGFVSVTVDGALAVDRASAPPLRRDGFRICTWGPEPAIGRVEIRKY